MQKRLNIRSFSKKAGYSVATVSRALNQQTASMVKAETRRKIQDLATQLNFVPHPGARVLRRTNPAPIAVLLPQKENIFLSEYYGQLLMGILQFTSAREQAVYAMAFRPDPTDFKAQLIEVTVGCEGIIYLSDPMTREMAACLAGLHQPFVCPTICLAKDIDESKLGVPIFGLNDVAGSCTITEHMIALGHRRIAFLGGPATKRDAIDRRLGFELAMKKHGLKLRPQWIFQAPYSFQAGLDAASLIQPHLPQITAVVCASDEAALGLMHKLDGLGIRCPRDISISGYDDLTWASRYTPALTTMRQPLLDMARVAVDMVTTSHRRNESCSSRNTCRFFEPSLIQRESTSAPIQ